jgi:hypothetical protein
MVALKILCLAGLLAIAIQDFKERKVYTGLLIAVITLMSILFILRVDGLIYIRNITVNLAILLFIIGVLVVYTTFKMQQRLQQALGWGDILFFIGIALSFPITTFLVLFTFSLCFALGVFLLLKPTLKEKTVPLAGLQAFFFLLVFITQWSFPKIHLYTF